MEFLSQNMPDHFVKPVPRDGLCILNAFRENLSSLGLEETVESIAAALRIELDKDAYKDAVVEGTNLLAEVDQFFEIPLWKYSQSVADVFLEALSMIYKVNIIVFQSNVSICDIINNINPDNNFQHTFYFVRAGSLHFDPVLPIISTKDTKDNHDCETPVESLSEYHSDSSESLVIVSPVKVSQVSVKYRPLSKALKSEDFRVSSVEQSI